MLHKSELRCFFGVCVALVCSGLGPRTSAQAEALAGEYTLAPVSVVGSKENIEFLPGAGDFLDTADLRRQGYDDINRVLRRVPGVYVREEDGYGLFPNISLRGVAPGRSSKVTIMEDGVLAAPAPYAAPAAYYVPASARMSGIEVLKGSSQIKYGPQTSGGVINFLSTPVPVDAEGYARFSFGTENEIRSHLYYGETIANEFGRLGILVEFFDRRTDGFKTIDTTDDFPNGDNTGFRRTEPLLKLSWKPNAARFQTFEFKIGFTEMVAHETYMGLTNEDFAADPFRRYAGSRFDRIDTEMMRLHLRHVIELNPDARLTSTAYYHEFKRNWFKERTTGADLGNPERLAVLRGEAPGVLRYRNNNREYHSVGVESVLQVRHEAGEMTHVVDAGLRLHQDQVKRFQRDDNFVQAANGTMVERTNGFPGSGGNRKEDAQAIAVFAQDAISRGAFTAVPGIRYEHIRMEYKDFDTQGDPGKLTGKGDSSLDIFAPGLGLILALDEQLSMYGGIYRGFSVPGPRANAKDGIKEETSIGYELGVRFNDRNALQAEATLFLTDFNDLIVPDILGAGGGTTTENAGSVLSYGAEMKVAYDPGRALDWGLSNPWYATLTLTQAELDSDTRSLDEESIFADGRKGARVPYIPEIQGLIGTGLETDRMGLFVDLYYVGSTFTTASNVNAPVDTDGRRNLSFGKTDSHLVVDLSAFVRVKPNVKLFASIHNLFDNEYVVARHPAGPRPGQPLTALAGLEVSF